MNNIVLILLLMLQATAASASNVTLPSGDHLVLPSGWQSVDTRLLKKKIIYLQYKKTNVQAKIDTDFLVNHERLSTTALLKNKCIEIKKFFSTAKNKTTLKITAAGCEVEIDEQNRKTERIFLKISAASTLKVVVINSMVLTEDASVLDLGPATKDLERAFFAISQSHRKKAQ